MQTTTQRKEGLLRGSEPWEYLGVSRSTFHRRVAPAVPVIRLTGKSVAYRREDLDAWVESRVEQPPGHAAKQDS